jgi:hypothetical protein
MPNPLRPTTLAFHNDNLQQCFQPVGTLPTSNTLESFYSSWQTCWQLI